MCVCVCVCERSTNNNTPPLALNAHLKLMEKFAQKTKEFLCAAKVFRFCTVKTHDLQATVRHVNQSATQASRSRHRPSLSSAHTHTHTHSHVLSVSLCLCVSVSLSCSLSLPPRPNLLVAGERAISELLEVADHPLLLLDKVTQCRLERIFL